MYFGFFLVMTKLGIFLPSVGILQLAFEETARFGILLEDLARLGYLVVKPGDEDCASTTNYTYNS